MSVAGWDEQQATPPIEQGRSRLLAATHAVGRSKGALFGFFILAVATVVAVVGPLIAPYPVNMIDLGVRLQPPIWSDGGTWDHPLGTDALGRDELSRMIVGTRVSMLTGLLVILLAGGVGSALGITAGYKRGKWGSAVMRTVDASIAFPGLLLALIVLTIVGPGQATVVIVLAAVTWMIFAKVSHDVVLVLKETPYVKAAEAVGCSGRRVVLRHLLPNLAPTLLTVATLEFAGVVLAEAALSYLGYGIQPPDASWGLMISEGQEYLTTASWLVVVPGVAISLVVIALNLVAAWLRVQTDPRLRARRVGRVTDRVSPVAAAIRQANGRDLDLLLDVRCLSVEIPLESGQAAHPVRGVDISVAKGQTLGLVGESGAGKSLTALALLGLVPPPAVVESASYRWNGTELGQDDRARRRLVGEKITMVFQDPTASLNPLLTVGDQLTEVLRRHAGFGRVEARTRAIELLETVGIAAPAKRVEQHPFELSGGIAQRVMVAMALAPEPELIIADEPTTALDVTIQAQILELLESVRDQFDMSVLLITHDLGVVARLCDLVAVMYAGRIVEEGPVHTVFAAPQHPYTAGLLSATPRLDRARGSHTIPIRGLPISPVDRPTGCAFAARCPEVTDRCLRERPTLTRTSSDHTVACWNPLGRSQ